MCKGKMDCEYGHSQAPSAYLTIRAPCLQGIHLRHTWCCRLQRRVGVEAEGFRKASRRAGRWKFKSPETWRISASPPKCGCAWSCTHHDHPTACHSRRHQGREGRIGRVRGAASTTAVRSYNVLECRFLSVWEQLKYKIVHARELREGYM